MSPIKQVAIAAAVALLVALPAGAQPPDADAPFVRELVVRAYGGPPWWRISDADTTVYIFTGPGQVPKGFAFDERLLVRRLTGANTLILAPVNRNRRAPSAMLERLAGELNGNTRLDLEPALPAPTRARFVAARERIGKPAKRYGALPSGLAGMALAGDAGTANAPTPGESLEARISALAQRQKVPIRRAGTVRQDGAAYMANLYKPGLPCLDAMLDALERPLPAANAALSVPAWAEGDIRPLIGAIEAGYYGARMNYQGPWGTIHIVSNQAACVREMPEINRIIGEHVEAYTREITRALRRPGHAVAFIDPAPLLKRGGVLDRAQKAGLTVTLPDAPE